MPLRWHAVWRTNSSPGSQPTFRKNTSSTELEPPCGLMRTKGSLRAGSTVRQASLFLLVLWSWCHCWVRAIHRRFVPGGAALSPSVLPPPFHLGRKAPQPHRPWSAYNSLQCALPFHSCLEDCHVATQQVFGCSPLSLCVSDGVNFTLGLSRPHTFAWRQARGAA